MTIKIYKLAPIFFIFFLWFIFSSPYFLKGMVPYPSSYQANNFHPWSAYEEFWGPIRNGAMPDVVNQIYPWKYFTINVLKSGEIPLWNPYSFSGNPHLANYQSAVLSPFNILFFIFPFVDAWSLLVLIQPLIAGVGTYLFIKEYKTSVYGSLISSVSFMFCGFIVVWMAYGTLPMAIVFLPLSLFYIKKIFYKFNIKNTIFLSLTIIISFISGHLQTSLYFLGMILIFLFFETLITKNKKAAICSTAGILLAVFICLIQIIPSINLYISSVRSEVFFSQGGIPFRYLITILFPDFYGNPVTRNDWFGYYAEWASYIGVVSVFLASYSFFGKKRNTGFFIILGFISLLLSIDSPIQKILGSFQIPVLSTSNPNRIIVLFSFCFAVLSGMGFDNLVKLIKEKKTKKIFVIITFWMSLIILFWINLLLFSNIEISKLEIAQRNSSLPGIFLSLIFLLIFLKLYFPKKLSIFLFSIIVLIAVFFESFIFVKKWMPFEEKDVVFKELNIIKKVKDNIENNRLFGNIGQEIGNYYSIQTIEGYDPLYIKRYGEFIRTSYNGDFQKAERSVVSLNKRGKYVDRVLDFLGVKIIFHRIQDTNVSWAYPVWEKKQKYSLIFQDKKFQLYKNNTAMDRAKLFYKYQVINNEKEILKKFYNEKFDYLKTLLLEENPLTVIGESGSGSAKILTYLPNRIVINTNSDKPALLLLTDNFYKGWKAYVNGVEKKIYRANYTFRAVDIPSGNSKVEFIYKDIF